MTKLQTLARRIRELDESIAGMRKTTQRRSLEIRRAALERERARIEKGKG